MFEMQFCIGCEEPNPTLFAGGFCKGCQFMGAPESHAGRAGGGPSKAGVCPVCSGHLSVEFEATLHFRPEIATYSEEHEEMVYARASDPIFVTIEHAWPECVRSCLYEAKVRIPDDQAIQILHDCGPFRERKNKPPEPIACPDCGAQDFVGMSIGRYSIDEPIIQVGKDGEYELLEWSDASWGVSGGSHSECMCLECEEVWPLYTNNWLTGWWVAVNCEKGEPLYR